MIMSSNKGYSWPAEHLLPVDGEEGQVGCKSVGKEGCIICCVVLLRVKVLRHATNAHTTAHISYLLRMLDFTISKRKWPFLNSSFFFLF